jgi:chloramphenicol-sensitive protein RarD
MVTASEAVVAKGLSESEKGALYCFLAHLVWGGMAFYFGLMRHISAPEIAIHRGLWSLPIAAVMLLIMGRMAAALRVLSDPRKLVTLMLTSFLIVFNWGFYVWSIEAGRTTEATLGYYMNPLLNVVAGYFFLNERFSRIQFWAIMLAAAGVLVQTFAAGVFPWVGLMLGTTFCLYGFIRKTVDVGPVEGFFVETVVIAGPALALAVWLGETDKAAFLSNTRDTLMLMGCGAVTSAALILFAAAIKRIRYSTAGLMQYISPSLVFLTAVFVFGEPMNRWKLASFVLIWAALAIFTVAALREDRGRTLPVEDPTAA